VIAALVILVPVVGAVAWAFFRFAPIHADRKAVVRFNVLSLAVALLLAAGWSVRTYRVMSPTVDSAWWPVVSVLGALVIVPLVLGLAAIVRTFLVFHRGTEVPRQ
jgi:hypothetical protein